MERLRRIVDGEMEAASLEHNEAAELMELAAHLQKQLNRVIERSVAVTMARDNDSPDVMTCCQKCGEMMKTPPRGGTYKCTPCLMELATGSRP